MTAMSKLTPIVLESLELLTFIQFILDKHAQPSALVVCSSKEAFLQQLHSATNEHSNVQLYDGRSDDLPGPENQTDVEAQPKKLRINPWKIPTLRLLASSRSVKLAFCPEVHHLRAYLAAYVHHFPKQTETDNQFNQTADAVRMLAIINPIQAHRPTSAFSAQGLNRTLSIAVEAAYQTDSQLVLAECCTEQDTALSGELLAGEDEHVPGASTDRCPWDEEVSILNVTTKSFGIGERGWVGRTVKIRTIAARWCRFQPSPDS